MDIFADDTVLMAASEAAKMAVRQNNLNQVSQWTKRWHIWTNEPKSDPITFTNRPIEPQDLLQSNEQ